MTQHSQPGHQLTAPPFLRGVTHRLDSPHLVAVCIPTIPPRVSNGLLDRAVQSVFRQYVLPREIHIAFDHPGAGAAPTRQAALDMVSPDIEWVAFLDDDDYWYETHLQHLLELAAKHQADFAYSWFTGNDPFPMHRGRQMDPANPHHTTMNVLVRADLARAIGFRGDSGTEDWRFIQGCVEAGARFAGTSDITWHYEVHEGNTSGRDYRAGRVS